MSTGVVRLAYAIGALSLACTGAVDGGRPRGPATNPPVSGPGPTTGGPPPAPVNPAETTNLAGPRPLRRLSLLEYGNTLRDLLGIDAVSATGFTVDSAGPGGFVAGASITSSVDAKQFVDASDRVATAVAGRLAALLPPSCGPVPVAAEDDCARQFIQQFGRRAYRRPLTADEQRELFDFYRALRGPEVGASFPDAIKELIAGITQAPAFLYRWELGGAPIKDGPLFRLDSWEIASRLSYFLWSSMPDEALFTAADRGELQTPERIATEARRMLSDPRAKDAIQDFHLQWLDVSGLGDRQKDPSFTNYSPQTAQSMLRETGALATAILWGPKASGKLADLFSTSTSYIDARLARLYGVPNVTGDELRPVALDPAQRAGLLTHGSFLAAQADADVSHPVKRGVHILRQVLCVDLPDPTGLDIPALPEPRPGQTTRQRYAAHAQGFCASCHDRIDGVGFALESYDATGAFRTTEQNQPVDSSGKVALPSGELKFDKGIDFIKALAGTKELRDCVTRQWFRYVLRRTEVPEEAGSLATLASSFESSGWDLREMLVTLTGTRAFTHRKPGDGEAP